MESLLDFFKALAKPKTLNVSLFFGSVLILVLYQHEIFQEVSIPDFAIWTIFILAVYAGVICFIWLLQALPEIFRRIKQYFMYHIFSNFLSNDENIILKIFADEDVEEIDVDYIDYNELGMTKVRCLIAVNSLATKGILQYKIYLPGERYSLTRTGRAKVVKMQ